MFCEHFHLFIALLLFSTIAIYHYLVQVLSDKVAFECQFAFKYPSIYSDRSSCRTSAVAEQIQSAISTHTDSVLKSSLGVQDDCFMRSFITLSRLVASFANYKMRQTTLKNDWSPSTWVLIWEYSVKAIPWIPTWQGLDGFQISSLCFGQK